jgi:hypothetical protein
VIEANRKGITNYVIVTDMELFDGTKNKNLNIKYDKNLVLSKTSLNFHKQIKQAFKWCAR